MTHHPNMSNKSLASQFEGSLSNQISPILTGGAISANVPYGTYRAPRPGNSQSMKQDILSSGTKLIDTNNIEYRKLTIHSANIDTDDLNSPKVGRPLLV